jgi:hypothetical protein
MKLSEENPHRLINEPGDSETQQGIAKHFNGLMDALNWFYSNGVRIALKRSKNGYQITLTDMSVKKARAART